MNHPERAALAPRAAEQLRRVDGDMRLGLRVILEDGADAILIALVETLTEDRYTAMTSFGAPELALTARRAASIGLRPAPAAASLRLAVPASADLAWLRAVAGTGARAIPADLPTPATGTMLQTAALSLAKGAQMLPAVASVTLAESDRPQGLTTMTLEALTEAQGTVGTQSRVSAARLPMAVSGAGRVHVFRPDDGGAEHYAIEIGTPDLTRPVAVRLHSACFTGDVLGSLKCDCGPQLRSAMASMAGDDGGVLLYLNQEGRGIGLANKMRAYALQDTGLDTVEANHWLGFEDDQRDFRIGAQILRRMGIAQVRLLTNNPAKLAILSGHGIDVVARVPLRVGQTNHNAGYLATKAAKSGHFL